LHRSEQHERTGARIELHIGVGKGRRIQEQRHCARPAACRGTSPLAQTEQRPQHQRASQQAQRGETCRIDVGIAQRDAAEQRVASESEHGQGGE